ncbi:MAG: carboxy terminal-processing peptidase [Bacteroidales bacterium]|nr:carboxy terminal-processing peptidase [Bacteroidales bacterium]MCF8404243.1 carboxy terminal-processing peptidase [Bacteroidales bacterium]
MNNLKLKLSALAILLLSVSLWVLASRSNEDDLRRDLLMKVVSFAVNSGHYDPGDINDNFSEKAWELYIDRIDYAKRFLLQEDVDKLAKFKHDIDDAVNEVNFDFFDLSIEILDKRTNETEGYFKEILAKPFDFEKEEFYEFDPDKREFAKSKKELKERWRLSLKYETMNRIFDMTEDQEKAAEKSDTVTIKTFAEIEKDAREKILKRYDDWYHRIRKLNEDDRLSTYVNAIVNVFDPHTEYFPPRDKENFDIRFSGQLEGIGAQLTQKNAYVEVSRVIPGSPSWKQGELEVGDFILKVAQDGEDPVDIVDMRLNDAVQLIRGKKGTKVILSIKKLDGTLKDISIIRDVVVLEETYAKSAIIKDDNNGMNYGYIKLPSFYVDFSKINGKNCFDDVKAELEKLKAENIEGLIFDLRDNGGGSLEDVVKIAGLFIEEGPVVQSMGRKGASRIYRDEDPQVQYDGPMVVMVNGISASASEIFAAAMQDYNRAIIIGGNSTFGKGTVQNFTELDRMVPKKPRDMQDLGSLKMTIQKFYRINGGSTQLKGVTPDIIFPDYYNYMDFGEKDMDNPLPWTEIKSLTWNPWNAGYDEDYIIDISQKRIQSDTLLQLVEENGKRLKDIRENTSFTLVYDDYELLMKQREEEGKRFDRIGKDSLNISIDLLATDKASMVSDTSKKARSEAWLSGLTKDVYLLGSVNVLKDIESYEAKNAIKEEE